MKLFSALQKGAQAAIADFNKPDSVRKGENFENYVREQIFTEEYYTLLERTHSFEANRKDYVKSSMNPDFKLLDKKSKKEFWLEVKYRSHEYGGKINWCTEYQLNRYLKCHKQTPTFVLLGIGGDADLPDSLYLLSMTQARYACLFDSLVQKYQIPFDTPVSSHLLWHR